MSGRAESGRMTEPPAIQVAVVMERTAAPNPWEPWQFRVVEVVPDEGVFGDAPRQLRDDGRVALWLHPGQQVALFPDECKGYFLNLTSGRPAWFVCWRELAGDPAQVEVSAVSVSYIEADRRMTADEHVEILPLPDEICEWLRVFTNEHFQPDTQRKVRAQSFLSPGERQRQAEPALDREALKAMFHSDPHFRTGDGLDVAAEDVLATARSPRARQQQIERARALGMLDDELHEQDKPQPDTPAGTAPRPDTAPPDEDTDLQLQRHDAAGRRGPGEGPGPGTGRGG
jgi:hypothetical protein